MRAPLWLAAFRCVGWSLTDLGPLGFANLWPGYRMLSLVNAGSTPLLGPTLMGVPLMQFGFADMLDFGGSGAPRPLTQLAPGEVFAALVPALGGAAVYTFGTDLGRWSSKLDGPGIIYATAVTAVPGPATLPLLTSALLVLVSTVARRRRAQIAAL